MLGGFSQKRRSRFYRRGGWASFWLPLIYKAMISISTKSNRTLHALLKALLPEGPDEFKDAKAAMVYDVTSGRTSSSSEMSEDEARVLIYQLQQQQKAKLKPVAGKIIHLCCLMGMTTDEGEADYPRINKFLQGIGSRNPRKATLWKLKYTEALDVVTQVELIYVKSMKK